MQNRKGFAAGFGGRAFFYRKARCQTDMESVRRRRYYFSGGPRCVSGSDFTEAFGGEAVQILTIR